MSTSSEFRPPCSPSFPPQNAPRVWFVIAADAPIAVALIQRVLFHGDYVVAGVLAAILEIGEARGAKLRDLQDEISQQDSLKSRLRVLPLDARCGFQHDTPSLY